MEGSAPKAQAWVKEPSQGRPRGGPRAAPHRASPHRTPSPPQVLQIQSRGYVQTPVYPLPGKG